MNVETPVRKSFTIEAIGSSDMPTTEPFAQIADSFLDYAYQYHPNAAYNLGLVATGVELNPYQTLDVAESLFTFVSGTYPISVYTQGAALAGLSQRFHLDPVQLRDTLLTNPDRLDSLALEANRRHHASKNSNVPKEVTSKSIRAIVNSGFTCADAMLPTDPERLATYVSDFNNMRTVPRLARRTSQAYALVGAGRSLTGGSIRQG